jgi:hypothetical protein
MAPIKFAVIMLALMPAFADTSYKLFDNPSRCIKACNCDDSNFVWSYGQITLTDGGPGVDNDPVLKCDLSHIMNLVNHASTSNRTTVCFSFSVSSQGLNGHGGWFVGSREILEAQWETWSGWPQCREGVTTPDHCQDSGLRLVKLVADTNVRTFPDQTGFTPHWDQQAISVCERARHVEVSRSNGKIAQRYIFNHVSKTNSNNSYFQDFVHNGEIIIGHGALFNTAVGTFSNAIFTFSEPEDGSTIARDIKFTAPPTPIACMQQTTTDQSTTSTTAQPSSTTTPQSDHIQDATLLGPCPSPPPLPPSTPSPPSPSPQPPPPGPSDCHFLPGLDPEKCRVLILVGYCLAGAFAVVLACLCMLCVQRLGFGQLRGASGQPRTSMTHRQPRRHDDNDPEDAPAPSAPPAPAVANMYPQLWLAEAEEPASDTLSQRSEAATGRRSNMLER